MNHTIEQIVNAMFAGAPRTDEVRALYEETRHNSQTLYQSLLERGVSGEEAMSAVTDSLRGVELLLRHTAAPETPDAIERLVSGLFAGVSRTDEVNALYEEMLSNCRERYEDMLQSGVSREDAERAVADSLSGVEELLSQYPRKDAPAAPRGEPDDAPQTEWTFDPEPIRAIELDLRVDCKRVSVVPSEDGLVRVTATDMRRPPEARQAGETLEIITKADERESESGFGLEDVSRMLAQFFRRGFPQGELRVAVPASLAPELRARMGRNGGFTLTGLTLSAANVSATNGDIAFSDAVALGEVRVNSLNGEIRLTGVEARGSLNVSATNGDIDLNGDFGTLTVSATNGDITVNGVCGSLKVNTINGDIEGSARAERVFVETVSGDVEMSLSGAAEAALKSVSGDVELDVHGTALRELTVTTTSGDASVRLADIPRADVHASAVSGDVSVRRERDPSAETRVRVTSVSGDVEVR